MFELVSYITLKLQIANMSLPLFFEIEYLKRYFLMRSTVVKIDVDWVPLVVPFQ